MSVRTIHGLSLNAIEAVVLGEEELEVSLLVLNTSDFIFVVDEVARSKISSARTSVEVTLTLSL
tara:strand:+ start:87 stop:278 length:192 start_codon:yes stop_codon:yes gene_type:complete